MCALRLAHATHSSQFPGRLNGLLLIFVASLFRSLDLSFCFSSGHSFLSVGIPLVSEVFWVGDWAEGRGMDWLVTCEVPLPSLPFPVECPFPSSPFPPLAPIRFVSTFLCVSTHTFCVWSWGGEWIHSNGSVTGRMRERRGCFFHPIQIRGNESVWERARRRKMYNGRWRILDSEKRW